MSLFCEPGSGKGHLPRRLCACAKGPCHVTGGSARDQAHCFGETYPKCWIQKHVQKRTTESGWLNAETLTCLVKLVSEHYGSKLASQADPQARVNRPVSLRARLNKVVDVFQNMAKFAPLNDVVCSSGQGFKRFMPASTSKSGRRRDGENGLQNSLLKHHGTILRPPRRLQRRKRTGTKPSFVSGSPSAPLFSKKFDRGERLSLPFLGQGTCTRAHKHLSS